MKKIKKVDMFKADELRYKKIQNLIGVMQGKGNANTCNQILRDGSMAPFIVGKGIKISGDTLAIRKGSYHSCEISKVTINTEGSMAIYDRNNIKICGCLKLNVGLNNIEMFGLWVWKNNILVEVIDGKKERIFQYTILIATMVVIVMLKIFKILT